MKVGLPPEYQVVQLDFPTECWIWQRARAPAGYGVFTRSGRLVLAHRDYYRRFVGEIPEGWVVHHKCWNKACVNPEHLEEATVTANNQGCARGADNTQARDRWIPRKRGKQVRLGPNELPYTIVDLGHESPCWLWRQALGKGGYPKMHFHGRHVYAHRFFYELAWGPIFDGLVLDHLCNHPDCVNPDHLEAVAQRENLRRKVERQRLASVQRFLDERADAGRAGSR